MKKKHSIIKWLAVAGALLSVWAWADEATRQKQIVLQTPNPKTIDQLINTVQLPPRSKWEVIP